MMTLHHQAQAPPLISVVIPTYNRADLLRSSLESLASQSCPSDQYEVVVVDDGSTDATPEVCQSFSPRLNLKYFRIRNSGISAAKNIGIFNATGSILLFFDDDDVADEHLLQEHLRTHGENPDENFGVLGYTTWAPTLTLTPVMEYITEVGQFLFAYKNLADGQVLDFTYFWGGRSSCKKSFLSSNGIFDAQFASIIEDIELGYRLSKAGFKTVFNREAVSYVTRPITFDEFCRRCEREGRSLFLFSQLHSDPVVQQYCRIPDPDAPHSGQVVDAEAKWLDVEPRFGEQVRRVDEIEALLTRVLEAEQYETLLAELRNLYWWTFNASKLKGMIEATRSTRNVTVV